jgi:hypothetical protein
MTRHHQYQTQAVNNKFKIYLILFNLFRSKRVFHESYEVL